MAIIYSYPSATPVVADILLITKASDRATKSVTLSSIKTLFGLNDSLNGVGTPGYIPFFETDSRLVDSFISQDANGLVFIGSQASGTRFTNTSVSSTTLLGTDLYAANIYGQNGGLLNIQGNTTFGGDIEVQGSIYATPIAYSSNQDAYALKMGANGNTAFDMGIKIKSNSGGTPYMSLRSHSTEDLLILEGGNVGIGTSGINLEDKLHVQGTVRAVVSGADGIAFNAINSVTGSSSGIRFDSSNASLTLKNSTNVITTHIRSSGFSYINSGRLGVGTSSPSSTLDVKETTTDIAGQIIVGGLIDADDRAFGKLCFANTAAANSQPNKILASIGGRKNGSSNRGILTFDLSDGSGALKERMRIDSYGYIGIGTTNPQRELDVVGTARITGTLELLQKNSNTFVGTNAGNLPNTTGSSNVALGFESLKNNTGGSGNTALGRQALYSSTGNNNTGTGSLALFSNTTGIQNTGIGRQALQNVTTGFSNVGVGHISGALVGGGALNTAPTNSVFIGVGTKAKTNNDYNQIVIGHNAIGEGTNTARIGNTSTTQLHVGGNDAGVVLKSPNGTAYIIKVTNAGALTVTAL